MSLRIRATFHGRELEDAERFILSNPEVAHLEYPTWLSVAFDAQPERMVVSWIPVVLTYTGRSLDLRLGTPLGDTYVVEGDLNNIKHAIIESVAGPCATEERARAVLSLTLQRS